MGDEILKEGFLGFTKSLTDNKFKEKYIKCTKSHLMILSGPKDNSKDAIDLHGATIGNSSKGQYCFVVNHAPNAYFFAAKTKDDFDAWAQTVGNAISACNSEEENAVEETAPVEENSSEAVTEEPSQPEPEPQPVQPAPEPSPGPPKKKLPIGAVAMPGFGPVGPVVRKPVEKPAENTTTTSTDDASKPPPNKQPPPTPQKSTSGGPPPRPAKPSTPLTSSSSTNGTTTSNPPATTQPAPSSQPPQKQTPPTPQKTSAPAPQKTSAPAPTKSAPQPTPQPAKTAEPAPVKPASKPATAPAPTPAPKPQPTPQPAQAEPKPVEKAQPAPQTVVVTAPAVDYAPKISQLEEKLAELAKKLDKEYAVRGALESQVKSLEQRLNEEVENRKKLEAKLESSLSNIGQAPVKKTPVKAKATFAYEPQDDDELGFGEGDIIEIIKEDASGWWEGSFGGKTGMFPAGFVEVVEWSS